MDLSWCRLCVNVVSSNFAQNLFEDSTTMVEIENLIGVKLQNDSSLPPYICEDCEVNLESAHKFKMRCLRAQNYFASNKFKERLSSQNDYNYTNGNADTLSQTIDKVKLVKSETGTESYDFDDIIEENLENSPKEEESSSEENTVRTQPTIMLHNEPTIYKKSKPKKYVSNRTWVCEFCGRIFTAHNHYHYHIRRHKGIKKYACNYCPMRFVMSTEKTNHERTHTGEKPFGCTYCDKKFPTEYRRKLHEGRMHTNYRPHKCNYCCKGFVNNKALKKHLLIHIGERYRCEPCNKTFSYECNYRTHCKSQIHKKKCSESAANE
ncbi:zinc finger protein 658-like [Teleopsis dalmanni]|uniref:zinc finger protein 658-like n=1 Tax=Teleopsis dalmanni TaxID=139649 RepID=UPI0018CCABB0|nr:zinc finger protein 658-like [Teleopsis dalmanni]XP_037955367.1 zinc finger protein 658-like [Teleopsis dalmanni]